MQAHAISGSHGSKSLSSSSVAKEGAKLGAKEGARLGAKEGAKLGASVGESVGACVVLQQAWSAADTLPTSQGCWVQALCAQITGIIYG